MLACAEAYPNVQHPARSGERGTASASPEHGGDWERSCTGDPHRLCPRGDSEAERASFRVPTDRPLRSGMDHASTQRGDLLERGLHIGDGEIRQRGSIAWARATFVNAEHKRRTLGLPTATFGRAALGEFDSEES